MDTQEALQSSSTPPIDTDMPWGWLVPLTPPVLSSARPATVSPVLVPVKGETMKVGRDHDSSDLTVDDSLFTGSNDKYLQCSQVSRVHFELKRVGSSVALIDQSMNGTYVNGIKVGKGKQQSLDQGDVVAILQRDFDVFVFVSEARLRKIFFFERLPKEHLFIQGVSKNRYQFSDSPCRRKKLTHRIVQIIKIDHLMSDTMSCLLKNRELRCLCIPGSYF